MALRNYSNTSPAVHINQTGGIGSVDTSFVVDTVANLPTAPFTAGCERGTPNQEIMLVTGVNSGTNTLTVTRGYDGTTAIPHPNNAAVQHCVAKIDYAEANAHINASTNVHGTTGALVDTGSVQNITGAKNFASLSLETPTADTVYETFYVSANTGYLGMVGATGSGQFTDSVPGDLELGLLTAGNTLRIGAVGNGLVGAVMRIDQNGPLVAANKGLTMVQYVGGDAGNTTRTTYGSTLTGSASGMTINFYPPPTGRVVIVLSSWIKATAGVAYMDCVITDTVTSTVRHAAGDASALQQASADGMQASNLFTLSGLTAGNLHTGVLNFRSNVSTSTASFDNFKIIILPSLGV